MAANRGEPLRLVILGKTGVGKSYVGNVILDREVFHSKASAKSVTVKCKKNEEEVEGRKIEVTDTPGVLDTDRSESDIAEEILNSIYVSKPGPHAFLLVIQVGRFSREEERAVKALKKIFGPKLADYTIVVFNRAQDLQDQSIEDYFQGSDRLREVVDECAGRYALIGDKVQNRSQVTDLVKKIDQMAIDNGRHFSNDMYEQSIRESTSAAFVSRKLKLMTSRVGKFFKVLSR